mgnify:FL=1
MIIGDNFFEGLQVVFGSVTVWSEVSLCYTVGRYQLDSSALSLSLGTRHHIENSDIYS